MKHQHKIKKLNDIRMKLKTEFIGIDTQIDQIISYITGWYLFNDKQLRPTIVNLFGMTGVGKTDLIKRLIEELNMTDVYRYMDMGNINYVSFSDKNYYEDEKVTNNSFDRSLLDTAKIYDEQACILTFDEIHWSPTITSDGDVFESDKRPLWSLLDTGIVEYNNNIIGDEPYTSQYREWLNLGIKIDSNMEITDDTLQLFINYANIHNLKLRGNKKEPLNIVRKRYIKRKFVELIKRNYVDANLTYNEFSSKIKKRVNSISDMILEIKQFYSSSNTIKYDLSRSLIFIIGNLDSVYNTSSNFEQMPADIFYDMTKHIKLHHIKNGLLDLMRPEQISRLGNNFVIYHGFKQNHFETMIDNVLFELQTKYTNHFGIKFNFTSEFKHYIYDYVVYPTQGMRPIKSNVINIVDNVIVNAYTLIQQNDIKIKMIDLHYSGEFIIKTELDAFKLNIDLLNNKEQYSEYVIKTTSLHESAHTLLSIIDTKIIPNYVALNYNSGNSLGYTYIDYPEHIETVGLIKSKIKVLLAGYVFERYFLKKQTDLSTGVLSDLHHVSYYVTMLFKQGLVSNIPIHTIEWNEYSRMSNMTDNKQYNKIIKPLVRQTKRIIKKHLKLLYLISDAMIKTDILTAHDLKTIVGNYNSTMLLNILNKENYYESV